MVHKKNGMAGLAFMAAAAAAVLPGAAMADKTLSVVHFQQLRGNWDISTVDAFAMMRFGCLEGLTTIDAELELKPLLAVSWERPSDVDWVFKLRDGVAFQDGSPFNADAAVTALNHVLNVPVPASSFNPTLIESVSKIDEMTVKITTKAPNPLLPAYLASPQAGILAPAAYADGKSNPFGTCTGPFTFTSEIAGQSFAANRNENYWGTPAKLDRVEVAIVADADTRTTMVRGRQVDLAFEIPMTTAASLANDSELQLFSKQLPRHLSMIFNVSRPPLDNPKVRRAIQMAMNIELLSEGFYEGLANPATGPFAPNQPWKSANLLQPLAYDLDGAKALLAETGVDATAHTLMLAVPNNYKEYIDNALFVQESLKSLGFASEIRLAPSASLQADIRAGKFDLTPMSRNILSVVADPIGYLNADLKCGGSFNLGNICIPELDALIEKASAMADTQERYKAYGEIEDYVVANALQLYLLHVQQMDVATNRVKGYVIHPLNYQIVTTDLDLAE